MASNTPDVRILVSNLGDASPSGESATLIRTNLEKALASGIKIRIVPDTTGGTTALTKGMTSLSQNADYAKQQLASLSTTFDTLKQKVASLNNVNLRNTATTQLQQQYDVVKQKLTEYLFQVENVTASDQESVQQRVAAMERLVAEYEKLDAVQAKSLSYTDAQKYKAASAMSGFSSMNTAQAQQALQIQEQLNAKLDEYAARKTNITAKEKLWVQEQIAAIKRLAAEQEKLVVSTDKIAASQSMQLANLNQYLTTVNPKALTEFSGEIARIRTLLEVNTPEAAQKASVAITKLKADIKTAGYEGGNAITYINSKLKTFATYMISTAVFMGFVNGVRTMIDNVENLDTALTDLRIVTGGTREETEELLKTYNEMAQQLGSTTTAVSESAVTWQRQGYSVADTNELIKDSMVLSIVGDVDPENAAQYLTSSIKGFQASVSDAIGIVDMLTAVDLEAAVSAGGLAEAMSKTANSARLAGVDMATLIGYLAVVGEVTQKDMSSVGNAFQTMFSRYSKVTAGASVDDDGEPLNDYETALRGIGIALRDASGEFRDFDDVLAELYNSWDKLTNVQKSEIAFTLGATRQRENVLVLLNSLGEAMRYTEIALNSSGTAMEKFSAYEESVEAKTNRATAAFENFSQNLLDSGLIGGVMDFATGLFNALSAFDAWPAKIAAVIAILTALKGAWASLKTSKLLAPMITSFKDLGTTFKDLRATISLLPAALSAAARGSMTLGEALSAININPVVLGITLFIAAIGGVVALYKHFNVTIDEHIEKLQKLNQEYESNESELQSLQSELETTAQRISELEGSNSLSFVEQGELEKLKETNEELTREIALLKQRNEELSSARDQEAQDAWNTMNTALTKTVVVDFDTDSPTTLLYTDVEYADYLMEQIKDLDKQINDLWADGMLDKSEKKTEEQLKKLRDDYKTTLEGIRDDAAAIGLDESNAFVDKILTFFDPSYGYELALKSVTSEMEDASEQLLELKQQMSEFEQGNVKLSIRPEVEIEGGYETVLSSWVDAVLPDDKTYAIHYTPILDDGTVLSESEIQAELDRLFEGAVNGSDILEMDKVENGGKGIILRVSAQLDTQTNDQFFSAENEWGQQLHLMQEEYYDLIRTIRENPEFVNLIELLKELGLISDDTAKSLLYIAESIATVGEAIDSVLAEKSFTDVYDRIEDGLKAISDAQKDVAETGYLSADSIKAIEKAGLSEYLVETEGGYKLAKGALDDYVASQRVEYEFALNEATSAAEQIINNSALEAAGYDTTTMSIYDQIKAMKELAAAKMIETSNAFIERRVATGDTYSEASHMLSSSSEYQAAYNYWKQISGVIDNINTAQGNLDQFNRAVASFQRDSASSSKSSSDPWKEEFEAYYNAHKHAVAMEQETIVDFYAWLDGQDGYKKYFANNEKYLDEFYKYSEEVFKGLRDLADDVITDSEHQIYLWENQGGHETDIVQKYRDLQEQVHETAESIRNSMRNAGWSELEIENSEIIQSLQKKWWSFADSIKDVFESISDTISDHLNDIEHYISMLEHEAGDSGINDGAILANYAGLKAYVLQTIDEITAKMQALGYTQTEIANSGVIQELQKKLWDYEDSINNILDTLNDDLYDSMKSLLDLTVEMIRREQEDEKDVLSDLIADYKHLVDLRKEMLQTMERERTYQENVSEQTSTISKIQARIDALALDDSRTAAIERASLMEKLEEAQERLNELQREHAIDCTEDQLDAEVDAYEDAQNEKIRAIEDFLNDNEALNQAALARLDNMNEALWNDLLSYALHYTSTTRDELEDMWNSALSAAQNYGSYVDAMSAAKSGSYYTDSGYSSGSSAVSGPSSTLLLVEDLIAKMKVNSAAWFSGNQTALANENAGYASQISSLIGEKVVRGNDGVWYIGSVGGEKLYDDYKKYCYHTGGVVGNVPTLKQNEVFSLLNKGELVLNTAQQRNLMAMLDQLKPLNALTEALTSFRSSSLTPAAAGGPTFKIDAPVYVDGTLPDKQIMELLKSHSLEIANEVYAQMRRI